MRHAILVLCFLTVSFTLSAQVYKPFQFRDTRWQYNESGLMGTSSYNYFSKDSVPYFLGGETHYRIEKQFSQSYVPATGGFYLRNDTANKKVFVFNVSANTDYLLYDFGAAAGDTINTVFNQPNILDTVVLDSIKTISILNIARKHFYVHSIVSNTGQPRVWIEGIGSPYELLYPTVLLTDPSYGLVCHEYNTIRNFGSNLSCNSFTVGLDDAQLKVLKIYPNPVSDYLFVEEGQLPQGQFKIQVYNLQSKVVAEKTSIASNGFSIDISNLKSGIYFLRLQSETGKTYYNKFLKR